MEKITQSMVIFISSASSVVETKVVTTSPTSIMEDTVGYVQPQNQATQVCELFPFVLIIPSKKSKETQLGPSGTSLGKCIGNQKQTEKATEPPKP